MKEERVYSSIEEGHNAVPLELWELTKPKVWCVVETLDNLQCQVEIGYGAIRLLYRGNVIAEGKHCATSTKAVALDREYYGVHKYIWV